MSGAPDRAAAAATCLADKPQDDRDGNLRYRAPACPSGQAGDDSAALAAMAAAEYARRRRRDARFGSALFADPAWDMLLDLFIHHHRGKLVSSHSLCIAAVVPPTTALRWIEKLRAQGLVTRVRSRSDQRVVHVLLTDRAFDLMTAYLRGEAGIKVAELTRPTRAE